MTLPEQAVRLTQGWLTNLQGTAHRYVDGHSVCHRWVSTTFERPATAGDARCPDCLELMERGPFV